MQAATTLRAADWRGDRSLGLLVRLRAPDGEPAAAVALAGDVAGRDRRDFRGPEQGVAHRAQERRVAQPGRRAFGPGRGGRG